MRQYCTANLVKTTLLLLCKLILHSCLWLIKLTTTVVLVLAVFLLQRWMNLLSLKHISYQLTPNLAWRSFAYECNIFCNMCSHAIILCIRHTIYSCSLIPVVSCKPNLSYKIYMMHACTEKPWEATVVLD